MSDKILKEAFDRLSEIEQEYEDTGWGEELVESMKLLFIEAQDFSELRRGLMDLIQQYDTGQ